MIPVFDLNDYEKDKEGFARELGGALSDSGFVRRKTHGLPADVLDAAEEAAKRFFDQPQDVKEQHRAPGFEGIMSYDRNAEVPLGARAPDLKEDWFIRARLPAGHPLENR